ncbi:MAG: hypothetical protein OEY94_09380 [Alphaproteobacteria bacterium]|nr:hypothetical protein [Alphaproteobacteria bacterium]
MEQDHFNQKPKRDAQFITPPNTLKSKVGDGGLTEVILNRAQDLLENNTQDFRPLAEIYLEQMQNGLQSAQNALTADTDENKNEKLIAQILYPCVQLKANGGMFHYQLVTDIANVFVKFMEVVERLDAETLEIAQAFYTSIKLIINGQIKGDGGPKGKALMDELNSACKRYFEKHKEKINIDKI